MRAQDPDESTSLSTVEKPPRLESTRRDDSMDDQAMDAETLGEPTGVQSGRLKPDTLLSGLLFLLGATVLQRSIGLVRSGIFFRLMDPAELGLWDVSYGFLLVAAPLITLGIPGTLPRYFDRFRRRGTLPKLLLQIVGGLTAVAAIAAAVIIQFRAEFGQWLFGRTDQAGLVIGVGLSLLAMAWFSIAVKFFVAMRLQRMASLMYFCHSLLFAVIGFLSLATISSSAVCVLFAHSFAMVVTLPLVAYWLLKTWRTIPVAESDEVQPTEWRSIGLFSISLCLSGVLTNVFTLVDRYMIVHYSGLGTTASLAMVGQYFAARIIPMLMISVATGFAFQMLPHLTQDWEEGRREIVGRKIDFTLRSVALFSFAFASLFLVIAPWIFSQVFADKFDTGLTVLGITLTSGILFCMFSTAKLHLWCFEKAWVAGFLCFGATVVNAIANIVLLPRYGLQGAATAHCLGVLSLLLGVYAVSGWLGMKFKVATFVLTAVPFTLFFGSGFAFTALLMSMLLVLTTNLIFDAAEKRQMMQAAREMVLRLPGFNGRSYLPTP